MKESLFFALLSFSGFSLFLRILGRNGAWIGVAVALPLGMLQWTVLSVLLVFIGLPMQVAAWILTAWCIFHWVSQLRLAAGRTLVPGLLLAITAIFGSICFIQLEWVQISFDSIEQIAIGRALAQTGFANEAGTLLASWGVLLPMVQSASVFLGVDMLTAMQPLLWLSVLGILVTTGWRLATHARLWIGLVPVALVASAYLFIFQSAYIHNSLVSAAFLLIFMAGVALATRENQARWLYLAFLGLAGFTLARTEAPLFAALALVLAASLFNDGPLWPRYRSLTLVFVASAIAWCLALMLLIGPGTDIMTPGRIGILAAVLASAAVVVAWPAGRASNFLRSSTPALVVLLSLAALALGYFWKPGHMLENIQAIDSNLFLTGRWGATWWIAVFVFPLLFALDTGRLARVFLAFLIAFASLVILLGIMRVPYRLGWGDSANRMFTHLLPVIALWLVHVLSSTGRAGPAHVPESKGVTRARMVAIGGVVLAALLSSAVPLAWRPDIGSADIRVRQAEGFCPPDGSGHYEFAVALAPYAPGAYAAACSVGPRSIELEITSTQVIRWIELQEYAPSDVWTDFSIRVSQDGILWTPIFEHKPGQPDDSGGRIGPTSWRIAVPADQPVRYITIDYRSSAGQNRLLLRRLTLIK